MLLDVGCHRWIRVVVMEWELRNEQVSRYLFSLNSDITIT